MRLRSLCLVVLLLLVGSSAPAVAAAAVAKNVKRVLADYKNDGKIDPCRHSAKDLRDTLKAIEANTEQYAPDFPAAVEAALEARASGECDKPDPTPTPTPTATAAPAPAAPAAPSAPPPPSAPDAPDAPEAPAIPEASPAPTAAPPQSQEVVPEPPAPSGGAGITPGTPAPAATDPDVKLERTAQEDSGLGPAPWIVLGGLVGAALLAALTGLFLRRYGWGEERLAPVVHAVGEAGYRTGGTWQSFTDWVRRGR